MNLEKRTNGEESAAPAPKEETRSKKPVVMYIMILFIAAFLLMALSFLKHQRSNTEVLGKLQNSVTAMQEVQALQDKIIELQEDMADLEDDMADKDKALEKAQSDAQKQQATYVADLGAAEKETEAMLELYTLQQQFSAGDYDACMQTMQFMETQGLVALLPTEDDAVTPPAQRYEQLKEAVLNR